MSLRIAITRAQPEAGATADRLTALGAEPVLACLLEVHARVLDNNVDGAQAFLFTSANGVRAAAEKIRSRTLPALTVGDATARAARDAGFADVRSARGDVGALAHLAASTLDPKAGPLIYFSGADVAADLTGWLHAAGFLAQRRVAYEARAVEALPSAIGEPLDVVLFHSARAAHTFLRLGAPRSAQLVAACISPAVATVTERVAWRRVIVASAPQDEALCRAAVEG